MPNMGLPELLLNLLLLALLTGGSALLVRLALRPSRTERQRIRQLEACVQELKQQRHGPRQVEAPVRMTA